MFLHLSHKVDFNEYPALQKEAGCRASSKAGLARSIRIRYDNRLLRRRTQVAKGEVCKTSIQRFESARRLQPLNLWTQKPAARIRFAKANAILTRIPKLTNILYSRLYSTPDGHNMLFN